MVRNNNQRLWLSPPTQKIKENNYECQFINYLKIIIIIIVIITGLDMAGGKVKLDSLTDRIV